MKAGHNLDALIGALVMGQVVCLYNDTYVFADKHGRVKGDQEIDEVPNYSTRIEDAWLVVEKFPERVVAVARSFFEDGSVFWGCTIGTAAAEAATAPLAICLAALEEVSV